MTLEEEGAYHRLLRYQWRNGSIPDDTNRLANIVGVTPKKMSRLRSILDLNFPSRKNPRLEKERVKCEEISQKRQASGSLGGKAKRANANQMPQICKPPCDSTHITSHISQTSSRETWLTPFSRAWEEAYGGEPAYGPLARHLKSVVDKHGTKVVESAWCRYLADTDAQYASPARFSQTFGKWTGPDPVMKGLSVG